MFGVNSGLGIDLGTSNVAIYARGRGIVLREPCVVAVSKDTGDVLAAGEDARQMLGRTPASVLASRPLHDGVVADFTVAQKMLRHLFARVCGRRLVKPVAVVAVPSDATSVERRAVLEAATMAGAKRAIPVEQSVAAAIGAGLPVMGATGSMVVTIGGGVTDIAVISLGGLVVGDCLRLGGEKMDEILVRHIKREHNLLIGERTAEEIKIAIGSAWPLDEERDMSVRGRDMVTGLPKTVEVGSGEVREALSEATTAIVDRIKTLLENTPPELAADIIDHGITLAGGGALLRGLDQRIAQQTQVPVRVADDPMSCVAIGAGQYLDVMKTVPRPRETTWRMEA
ncbi:MAG: rod shape-determining protein [Armatimonadota bacterium]|nr:MAG: rod shape-determining protein [Armatimonadota bacterium]